MREQIEIQIENATLAISFSLPWDESWQVERARDERGRFLPLAPWNEGASVRLIILTLEEYFADLES